MGAELIERKVGFESLDAIAGGETAGIPFAAWIADRLSLPMLYVRKQPKGFGRNAQIEGQLADGARVLLVEDLASEGTSKLNFVRAIRQAGGEIGHTFVIFNYGIFPHIDTSLAGRGHHPARARELVGRRRDGRTARPLRARAVRQDQGVPGRPRRMVLVAGDGAAHRLEFDADSLATVATIKRGLGVGSREYLWRRRYWRR